MRGEPMEATGRDGCPPEQAARPIHVIDASGLGWQIAARREDEGDRYREERDEALALLRGVVVAAGRMCDGWAEGDAARKGELWRNLHSAAEAAHHLVYSLVDDGTDDV